MRSPRRRPPSAPRTRDGAVMSQGGSAGATLRPPRSSARRASSAAGPYSSCSSRRGIRPILPSPDDREEPANGRGDERRQKRGRERGGDPENPEASASMPARRGIFAGFGEGGADGRGNGDRESDPASADPSFGDALRDRNEGQDERSDLGEDRPREEQRPNGRGAHGDGQKRLLALLWGAEEGSHGPAEDGLSHLSGGLAEVGQKRFQNSHEEEGRARLGPNRS